MLAHAKRALITGKVQQSLNELGLDVTDVLDCLCQITVQEIHKEGPDERIPDKRVFVFRKRYEERLLYVKVSVRLAKDHDLTVLSFKEK